MSTHEYLSNDYFLLTLTFGVYFLAKLVRKLLRLPVFNPILVSIAFLIIFLRVADVDYEEYRVSGAKIDFWLKPAVVALGVPLYKQLSSIRQEILPILLSQLAGCVVGVVSVVGIARLMGASTDVVLSLAAKSARHKRHAPCFAPSPQKCPRHEKPYPARYPARMACLCDRI